MQERGLWAGAGAGAATCLPYLKYMRPLFPTLATANCLPSRPAEPPSGAISHLSSSWLAFFGRRPARISSCDRRSVTGSRGFVFPRPRLGAPRPVVFARLPSAPSRGGGGWIMIRSGDVRTRVGGSLGERSRRRGRVLLDPVAADEGDMSGSIAQGTSPPPRLLSGCSCCCFSCCRC